MKYLLLISLMCGVAMGQECPQGSICASNHITIHHDDEVQPPACPQYQHMETIHPKYASCSSEAMPGAEVHCEGDHQECVDNLHFVTEREWQELVNANNNFSLILEQLTTKIDRLEFRLNAKDKP